MSAPPRPATFFVPEPPLQYVSDFAPDSNTKEALLLRLLLHTDTPTAPPPPAIVLNGAGGTGKTTALLGLAHHPATRAKFPTAICFITLGQEATPIDLLQHLEMLVARVVGKPQAEQVARLARGRSKSNAIAEVVTLLNDRDVLLLLDDLWADESSPQVGTSTVFSLVQECLRKLHRNPGRLRVVVSTRDAGIASLIPASGRVSAQPFQPREQAAARMLCEYADMPFDEVTRGSSALQESLAAVLDICQGMQLALAVAGSGIRDRMQFGGLLKGVAWCQYARELKSVKTFLMTTHTDHSAISTMLRVSLNHLKACLEKDGVVLPDEVMVLFSLLAVLRQQNAVPLSVVECIWGMSKDETVRLCTAMARLHLISLREESEVLWVRIHDLHLSFCDTVLEEVPGRKSFANRATVEALEKRLLGVRSLEEDDWAGCPAFWKLCDVVLDTWTRDYCVENLARHMVEAGGQYRQRLLRLLTDYRWVAMRLKLSKRGSDLDGFANDLQTLARVCEIEGNAEIAKGLELIMDAARLSLPYVDANPLELAFQLVGRLVDFAGQNAIIDRFLWTLNKFAEKPWLLPGKGVLKAAGGAVVLSASLPHALRCVAVLPNGEDVVIGDNVGHLAVFSIRYATELYELRGHEGEILCVVVCEKTGRAFSGGADGTIRGWTLGKEQEGGDVIVLHKRSVQSIALTADGSRVVFGDCGGYLSVCDSTSGVVKFRWSGHSDSVTSLAVRRKDGMIVSGSNDGTVGRWESMSGQEFGVRVAVGGGEVKEITLSRDGQRIAFAAQKKVGVINTDSGTMARESSTEVDAWCAAFGSDDQTVHFGRIRGVTAALAPDGSIVGEVKAHSDLVLGMTANSAGKLLVSISNDCTISVQNSNRSCAAHSKERLLLFQFAVLPDRIRVLYSWRNGSRGLQLLDIRGMSLEAVLSEGELISASEMVGSAGEGVSALVTSRDSRWVVAGTALGKLVVDSTDSWLPRYADLRCLRGAVSSTAFSSDGNFFAAGSLEGDIALWGSKDGGEVQLPSSQEIRGMVFKVAFSEESCALLCAVYNPAETTGMLHIWRHICDGESIEHVAIPFDKVSKWKQPVYPMSMIAASEHVATRYLQDSAACVYDCNTALYSTVTAQQEDTSGLLEISRQEHSAFAFDEALFIEPFERAISYRRGSNIVVLGTLEAKKCGSFRPEDWTFDNETGIFIAGIYGSTMVTAQLLRQDCMVFGSEAEEPRLPPLHQDTEDAVSSACTPRGRVRSPYSAFISHAGPDKRDIALPLYRRLMEESINTFVDKEELRPGDRGADEMKNAMRTADVGIFITSPEFISREWPMRELSCFLSRNHSARKPPVVLPVFYRLNVHECRSNSLFNMDEVVQAALKDGFYTSKRQKEMPISRVLELLKGLACFTGIENEEGAVNDADCTRSRLENKMRQSHLIDRIVDGVLESRMRRDQIIEQAHESESNRSSLLRLLTEAG